MTAAATAAADVRYAEPGGNGAPADCFQSDPCDLEVATSFTYTENGDEVIVLPGVHNMGSTSIFIQDNIDVHGVGALAQETRIVSTANNAVHLQGLGAKLRNVQVEGSGISAAVYMSGGVLDRVVALSSDGYGCLLPAVGVISNSMCISTFATFGVGLSYQNTSSGVRNASIRGSLMIGPAGGLHASTSFSGADSTIDVKSSIIAATDGGFDVLANAAHASSSLDIVIDHSNFDNAAVLPSSPGLDTVTSRARTSTRPPRRCSSTPLPMTSTRPRARRRSTRERSTGSAGCLTSMATHVRTATLRTSVRTSFFKLLPLDRRLPQRTPRRQ